MRAKIGDVVIDKTYNKKGNLAIVVGEGISQPILIDHKGGITMDKLRDYFAVWDGLEVIGHIDLERIWEEAEHIADRKTENSSEKPNNCETCIWSVCNYNKVPWDTDCNGCKFVGTYDTEFPCANCSRKTKDYYTKDEPQTDCPWK